MAGGAAVIPARLVTALIAGGVALVYFHYGRGYPVPATVVMATAIGALVWVGWRTVERLTRLYRRE